MARPSASFAVSQSKLAGLYNSSVIVFVVAVILQVLLFTRAFLVFQFSLLSSLLNASPWVVLFAGTFIPSALFQGTKKSTIITFLVLLLSWPFLQGDYAPSWPVCFVFLIFALLFNTIYSTKNKSAYLFALILFGVMYTAFVLFMLSFLGVFRAG